MLCMSAATLSAWLALLLLLLLLLHKYKTQKQYSSQHCSYYVSSHY
jgi:hypothetical protein